MKIQMKYIIAGFILASMVMASSCNKATVTAPAGSSDNSSAAVSEITSDENSVAVSDSSAVTLSEVVSLISEQASSTTTSSKSTVKSSAASSSKASSQSTVKDNIDVYSMKAAQLDAIPKETVLKKWDIAWAPTPTTTFFDFKNNYSTATPIWRGGKFAASAFDDAQWGLIMNSFETANDDKAGIYIYNKADVAAGSKTLEIIGRCNTDPVNLSGRGAFRVSAIYKKDGKYTVQVLKVNFSENQVAQADAAFKQGADGYVTFEAPPKNDKCDAFLFDISSLAGKPNVIFLIEVNDRMDTKGEGGANLADRLIIAAIRIKS